MYDRQLILNGQLWRIFTAPFVHFSVSHLIYNLLVFATAGWLVECTSYRKFGLMCILSFLLTGIFYLTSKPDLHQYGGISGLACGAIAYLCFCRIQMANKDRNIWIFILAVLIAKIIFESFLDSAIFVQAETLTFQVLPSAHILGVTAAVVAFFAQGFKLSKSCSPSIIAECKYCTK